MSVLVVALHSEQALDPSLAPSVAAAVELGAPVHVLLAGAGCGPAADEAARLRGVDRVRLVQAAYYAHPSAENLALLIAQCSGAYRHVLFAHTERGLELAPRVAGLIDIEPVLGVVRIETPERFVCSRYRDQAWVTLTSNERPNVLSVHPQAYASLGVRAEGCCEIESMAPLADLGVSRSRPVA